MLEAASYPFMQTAALAIVLAGVACGIVGALVVVNRMTFLAGGVAHAAYGGVGLAFFLGWPVMATATGFAVAAAVLAAIVTLRARQRMDVAVGLLWSGGMAFGVLLIDLTPGYNVDLTSYLFGSLLAVGHDVLGAMAVLVGLLVGLVTLFYRPLLMLSADREFARARGLPVDLLHVLLVAAVALAVMAAVPAIGLVLVIALLTIPAYMAELTARSLGAMMVTGALWAVGFGLAGLALAYAFDLTSGAAIVAVAVTALAAAESVRLTAGRRRTAKAPPTRAGKKSSAAPGSGTSADKLSQ